MSNVYLPVHVVALFRRLVDVISALSISSQYLRLVKNGSYTRTTGGNADDTLNGTNIGVNSNREPHPATYSSWATFQALRAVEWPWWTFPGSWRWDRFNTLSSSTATTATTSSSSSSATPGVSHIASLPWFSRDWLSWHSVASILSRGGTSISSDSASHHPPPLPSSQENHTRSRKTSSVAASSRTKQEQQPSPCYRDSSPADLIHHLLQNPALYDPIRTPRYPIVLCHGLYGFDVRGPSSFPSLRMHYWSNVLSVLKDRVGAEVLVTSVPSTGSIASRSTTLHQQVQDKARGRGINFLAHSMGGLDCRYLISHIKPTQYAPLSLTTVSTPHRGSPFMDWCVENIGIGKLQGKESLTASPIPDSSPTVPEPSMSTEKGQSEKAELPFAVSLASLPSSFTTLLLSIVDSPAYANLTTTYLTRVFNPLTPDDPRVRYFSVAGRVGNVSVWHPLWLPKIVLDGVEGRTRARLKEEWVHNRSGVDGGNAVGREVEGVERTPLWAQEDKWGNDGLVTVQSARWGEFLGTLEGCDHWAMRGARGIDLNVDLKPGSVMDGWTLRDWGRLVGAWRREEAMAESGGGGGGVRERNRREQEERADEAFIKSSTDKLSAVFDWLVEQVPAPRFSLKGKGNSDSGEPGKAEGVKRNLSTRMDLERFYVAFSRKLYDEGL